MNNSNIYKTRNYITRQLKEPIYIVFTILMGIIDPLFFFIGVAMALFLKTQGITMFEVANRSFKVIRPYLLFGASLKEYSINEIEEIRIKKRGNGGYGNMPFLDVHLKDGTRRRHPFDTLEHEDFEGFVSAIKEVLGNDRLFVNEL